MSLVVLSRIKMHEERKTRQKAPQSRLDGPVPRYILDREEQTRAKVLSNTIKQKRKEKAVSCHYTVVLVCHLRVAWTRTCCCWIYYVCIVSLLQAVDPSVRGQPRGFFFSIQLDFSASSTLSCKSSMLCLTTSIHLFLCLPLLRCPPTFASKICLTQSSSSRRCTCPYHLSLASCTLSVIHTTPRMRRMSSFLFLSLKVRPDSCHQVRSVWLDICV